MCGSSRQSSRPVNTSNCGDSPYGTTSGDKRDLAGRTKPALQRSVQSTPLPNAIQLSGYNAGFAAHPIYSISFCASCRSNSNVAVARCLLSPMGSRAKRASVPSAKRRSRFQPPSPRRLPAAAASRRQPRGPPLNRPGQKLPNPEQSPSPALANQSLVNRQLANRQWPLARRGWPSGWLGAAEMDQLFDDIGLKKQTGPMCPKCGGSISPTAALCTHCGFNLQTGEQAVGFQVAHSPSRIQQSLPPRSRRPYAGRRRVDRANVKSGHAVVDVGFIPPGSHLRCDGGRGDRRRHSQ